MPKTYFISSVGTSIGKTYFMSLWGKQLISSNKKTALLKPVISGNEVNSDVDIFLKILKHDKDYLISPWQLDLPISPHLSASYSNYNIDFQQLISYSKGYINDDSYDYVLIEGAGGIMVPINWDHTIGDLVRNLQIPVILVIHNYLGVISHTLTAVQAMKANNIIIHRIVMLDLADETQTQPQDPKYLADIIFSIEKFTQLKVVLVRDDQFDINS